MRGRCKACGQRMPVRGTTREHPVRLTYQEVVEIFDGCPDYRICRILQGDEVQIAGVWVKWQGPAGGAP